MGLSNNAYIRREYRGCATGAAHTTQVKCQPIRLLLCVQLRITDPLELLFTGLKTLEHICPAVFGARILL